MLTGTHDGLGTRPRNIIHIIVRYKLSAVSKPLLVARQYMRLEGVEPLRLVRVHASSAAWVKKSSV